MSPGCPLLFIGLDEFGYPASWHAFAASMDGIRGSRLAHCPSCKSFAGVNMPDKPVLTFLRRFPADDAVLSVLRRRYKVTGLSETGVRRAVCNRVYLRWITLC